jgi:Membrane carboxypeptidase (penicillin-binding protein)
MNKEQWTAIGRKSLIGLRNILLSCFAFTLLLVILYKYMPVYTPANYISYKFEQGFSDSLPDARHKWVALSDISPEMRHAAVAAEDNLFLIHHGFAYTNQEEDVFRAIRNQYYIDNGTISQQTARAVFLFGGDNLLNDLFENYFTLLIEFVWGKERILEVYLNSVEMATGTFGAEAMTLQTYDKPAAELNQSEAALIATVINNPKNMDISAPSADMLKRQVRIISQMERMPKLEF